MTKAERIIFILSLLRGNRILKAKDLAQKCGVSERTIYRDIISISGINIPIYFENGYKLISQNFLPPVNFTPAEADCLVSILLSGSKYRRKATNKIIERILDKLQTFHPPNLVSRTASNGILSTRD
jgi:predicted DNA-binding transcriptional regulator YafY